MTTPTKRTARKREVACQYVPGIYRHHLYPHRWVPHVRLDGWLVAIAHVAVAQHKAKRIAEEMCTTLEKHATKRKAGRK